MLAKQIEQFYNEINNTPNSSGLLKYELVKIMDI